MAKRVIIVSRPDERLLVQGRQAVHAMAAPGVGWTSLVVKRAPRTRMSLDDLLPPRPDVTMGFVHHGPIPDQDPPPPPPDIDMNEVIGLAHGVTQTDLVGAIHISDTLSFKALRGHLDDAPDNAPKILILGAKHGG